MVWYHLIRMSDYENYLRTLELLALQKTPREMVHRDELLFQTVHQSSELWLKHGAFGMEEAAHRIGQHDLAFAAQLLRRGRARPAALWFLRSAVQSQRTGTSGERHA